MLIQTILNHVEKYKSFVYGEARWKGSGKERDLEVEVRPRKNGRPRCSGCHKLRPGYDRLAVRRFEFPPLWAIHIFLLYALRRVNCPGCGIVVE